jgi:putative addiction module component (TIGR02574 family)
MVVDIAQLSVAERIQLVEDLWDSLVVTLCTDSSPTASQATHVAAHYVRA